MASATLATLHRYPVKSMLGEDLNAARITPRGLFGDRSFALCDSETQKIASAKTAHAFHVLLLLGYMPTEILVFNSAPFQKGKVPMPSPHADDR